MKQAIIGEFEEIVLLVVAAQDDQAYGLSVANIIEQRIKRSVTLSSVHTALYRLEEKGFVKSHMGEASKKRGGRKKRHFTITSAGKKALVTAREARNELWSMIPQTVIDLK